MKEIENIAMKRYPSMGPSAILILLSKFPSIDCQSSKIYYNKNFYCIFTDTNARLFQRLV